MDEQYPQSNVHPAPGHSGGGKAWLWVFLVIVLIAGAAGGVYYWQQQQAKKQAAELQSQIDDLKAQVAAAEKKAKEAESTDDTKDWKTYENSSWKFSIKYPSNYVIFVPKDCPGAGSTKEVDNGASVGKTKEQLPICNADKMAQIDFSANAGPSTLQKDMADTNFYSNVQKSEITLNGVKGYKYTYTNTGNGMATKGSKGIIIEFVKGSVIYVATYYEDGSSYPNDSSTFDKIVKTWKF